MKARVLAVLALALPVLAGCGRPKQVSVVFRGSTPVTSAVRSARVPEFHCPVCNHRITTVTPPPKTCPSKPCGAKIDWSGGIHCAYCSATGECPACRMMEQDRGLCYNCRGQGKLMLLGQTRPCPNCRETKGKCPSCKGSGKCDFCAGEKEVPVDRLLQLSAPVPEEEASEEDGKEPEGESSEGK